MRIVRLRWKLAYFVGGWFASAAIVRPLIIGLPIAIEAPIDAVFTAAIYCGAARAFRGAGEPIYPPRAWWRMTARPRASLVLAIILLAGASSTAVVLLLGGPQVILGANAAMNALFAALFFNSYARLKRDKPPGSTLPTTAEWRPAPLPRALR